MSLLISRARTFLYNGAVVAGGSLEFREPDTSTPKTVYSDAALSVALGSTVNLNAGGQAESSGSPVDVYGGDSDVVLRSGEGVALLTFPVVTEFAAQYSRTGQTASRTLQAVLEERINVKDYGATGDGSTDDTAAIQEALDDANSLGGATVFFPIGTYSFGTLTPYARVEMLGENMRETALIQRSGTIGDMIANNANTDDFICIRNMTLDGNKAGQTASNSIISLDGGGAGATNGDHNHVLEDLQILNAKDRGVELINGVRNLRASRVIVHGCDGRGWSIGATDCTFAQCQSGATGEDGWVIGGANNRLDGCKAFSAGNGLSSTRSGFEITADGDRTMMTSCEAQDNDLHGFHINGAVDVSMSGCIGDSNGVGGTGAGLRLDSATGCTIAAFRGAQRSGKTTQEYGLIITAACSGNTIQGSFDGNQTADILDTTTLPNEITVSKRIEVTGTDATPDVNGARFVHFAHGSATTVTDLDGAHNGQVLYMTFANANTTFDVSANSNMTGNGAVDFTAGAGDVIQAVHIGGVWTLLIADAA